MLFLEEHSQWKQLKLKQQRLLQCLTLRKDLELSPMLWSRRMKPPLCLQLSSRRGGMLRNYLRVREVSCDSLPLPIATSARENSGGGISPRHNISVLCS